MIHIGKQHPHRGSCPRASAPARRRTPIAAWCGSLPSAAGARNYTQCDSLLIGDHCGAHTVPYIEGRNPTAKVEHEATTSKIAEDQLFYCRSAACREEDAVGADRQRLLQRGAAGAADGVRGRGAEAARRSVSKGRRWAEAMLEIRSRTSTARGRTRSQILQGRRPRGAGRRSPCHHGAERLGQVDARLRAGRAARATR